MIKTVWIVEGDDFEDQAVRSVWTTEKAAWADKKRRQEESSYEKLNVNEYDVDPKPNDPVGTL